MKLAISGSGEEEKHVVGSAASRSDMHHLRKRPLMTEEQLDYFGQSYKYNEQWHQKPLFKTLAATPRRYPSIDWEARVVSVQVIPQEP